MVSELKETEHLPNTWADSKYCESSEWEEFTTGKSGQGSSKDIGRESVWSQRTEKSIPDKHQTWQELEKE